MQVWKFILHGFDEQIIRMPIGAKTLTAQFQGEALCLWALCDPRQEKYENRYFCVTGTGFNVSATTPMEYISTVQNGMFVWHVFELTDYIY